MSVFRVCSACGATRGKRCRAIVLGVLGHKGGLVCRNCAATGVLVVADLRGGLEAFRRSVRDRKVKSLAAKL